MQTLAFEQISPGNNGQHVALKADTALSAHCFFPRRMPARNPSRLKSTLEVGDVSPQVLQD